MDILDQLRQRVENAVVNLAHNLIANGDEGDMLPIGDIEVKETDDGVRVHFISKPKPKSKIKALDES